MNAVRKNIIPAMTVEVGICERRAIHAVLLCPLSQSYKYSQYKCSKLPFLETTPELMKMSGENKIELVRTYYDKHSILSKNYIR